MHIIPIVCKVHIDTADGGIRASCILIPASTLDGQVSVPLTAMTAHRVVNLHDLMDSVRDAPEIGECSTKLGYSPTIAENPTRRSASRRCRPWRRRERQPGGTLPEDRQFDGRTTVERVNSRLKDPFGGRHLRVRGHAKVACHLLCRIRHVI